MNDKKYDVLTVASYIIRHSWYWRHRINKNRLLFLLFLLQGKFLSEKNIKLFDDEFFYSPKIWYIEKIFNKISENPKLGIASIVNESDYFLRIDYKTNSIIDDLIYKYCNKTEKEIRKLIYNSNLWKYLKNKDNSEITKEISVDLIREYFLTDEGKGLINCENIHS